MSHQVRFVLCRSFLQYQDGRTADVAKAALQGHAMYDGGHNVVSTSQGHLAPKYAGQNSKAWLRHRTCATDAFLVRTALCGVSCCLSACHALCR